jgi:hypothetical protein
MEKMMISLEKGRGRNTLIRTSRKKASSMPHHHLNMSFIMELLFISRLLKNAHLTALRCKPPRIGSGAGVLDVFIIRLALRFFAHLASKHF